MKGKRTCKKRLLAFMLIFAMLAGMVMNPIHLQAVEGEPEKEETYTISGRVIVNNIGVAGAIVSYGEEKDSVATNEDGCYTISDLCAGEYTLVAMKDGLDQVTKTVTVTAGDPKVV